MPIIQENPTYFSDKTAPALSHSRGTSLQHQPRNQPRCGISTYGARRKLSVTSCEDTEDGSEMETFLSSCESNNSYNTSDTTGISSLGSSRGLARVSSHRSCNLKNASITTNGYTNGSLKRNTKNKNYSTGISSASQHADEHNNQSKLSGISSLTRLGQLFKKSKSKLSVGSESQASTIESSGIGSPTCTPDSSLSIYTNSLDGDSQSSNNSNQISPKHLEESMEDRFCSTYSFDDCGIFAANMYYNVGEASVFTIYHQHNNNHANADKNGSGGMPLASSSRGTNDKKSIACSVGAVDRNNEFEDCVQPYYNNTTFSTFPNPKRCSVASAASTTTSSIVPIPIPQVNEKNPESLSSITGKPTTDSKTHPIQHDRDGYLRPNEPRNLRNVKNLYINDSVIASANRNGQVQQVQVDVHTPTSSSLNSAVNQNWNSMALSEGNSSGGCVLNSSGASSGANSGSRYQFDSASSTTSAATTLVAGGSNNFLFGLPEDENIDEINKSSRRNRNGPLPVYMNRAYFSSNSITPTPTNASNSVGSLQQSKQQHHQRISSASVAADCEPYCSLCASSIMGSPRQRSKMDVAIVKCRECFFSREAESHIRGFFDKLMTEDKQKMDVTLKSYDLKDLDHPTDRVVVHSAKVQIVIISHHFLQRLKDEASRRPRLSPINRVFRSKNVIAVLLAVTAREVLDGYEPVLPRFPEWFSVDLRSTNKYDPEFCKKFTEQVVRIYNVELSNSSNFSVFPKKVTREQPKIAIVFKKPVEQNDEVRVELKTGRQANVISQVKLENPHTTLLRIPESLSPDREAIVDVSVFVNNVKIGGSRIKSELNARRIDDDDIDRMAKLLPPFLGWIDKHIAETLLKHYKECTDYTADPELELMNGIIICKSDIIPTIMHFAAYYGLRKTAFTVLEEADGLPHCNIKNELDETPVDIAVARGHTEVAQFIKDYLEISHSYTAYRFIKEIVDKENPSATNNDDLPAENTFDFENVKKLQKMYEEVLPEQSDSLGKTDKKSEDEDENLPVSVTETIEGPPSEAGSSAKSEGEDETEVRAPTPPSRRAKCPNRRQYVNVDGDPANNPEVVQPREKHIMPYNVSSSVNAQKRLTIMENYDIPRLRDQDYEVPPPDLRPVHSDCESSAPVLKPKKQLLVENGYIVINENPGSTEVEASSASVPEPGSVETTSQTALSSSSLNKSKPGNETCINSTGTETLSVKTEVGNLISTKRKQSKNDVVALDAADEQLIELLNDFKNKTYDMKMVELLFENWKQRPDVQKSIEMKMEMLDKWRDEYRKLQQQHSKKKSSVLDKIKTSLTMKRKKSGPQVTTDQSHPGQHKELLDISTHNTGFLSPTDLTFKGPFTSSKAPASPPGSLHNSEPFRVSESSYRTSIGSRYSDSSVDSDKPTSEASTNSNQNLANFVPPKYNDPMSKRFIPTYVVPNHLPHVDLDGSEISVAPPPKPSSSPDTSYQVPPPPRPVKSSPNNHADEKKTSPIPSKKPPVIPEESTASFIYQTPPAVPAKPTPKYLGTEATSPPPVPPPRTNISPNAFNYIDYKRRNHEPNDCPDETVKKSYENMNG